MDWNIPLWILQVVVAIAFLGAGYRHTVAYEQSITNPRMVWMTALPKPFIQTIGILEFLGAIGLILPALTGIARWLTPLAALMLAILMLCALVFHVTRRELPNAAVNAILGLLAALVAYGRYVVSPF